MITTQEPLHQQRYDNGNDQRGGWSGGSHSGGNAAVVFLSPPQHDLKPNAPITTMPPPASSTLPRPSPQVHNHPILPINYPTTPLYYLSDSAG